MIQCQLKLKPTKAQETRLEEWLFVLTGVWNWAIRKIELDKNDGVEYSSNAFHNLLADHGLKLGIPSHTIQGLLNQAYDAWRRFNRGQCGKPKLKGNRNKLNSIPLPDPIKAAEKSRIKLPFIGSCKFHKQAIPKGKIKCGRIVKRASGWHICLFIDAERERIFGESAGQIGIDLGFKDLIVTSDGHKVERPRELENLEDRIKQAQRGRRFKLAGRIHERAKNKRKDRNHKLSLNLVRGNQLIACSKDKLANISKTFGRSVLSSAHYQLRQIIAYKSRSGGTQYVEVDSRNSTKTCSACGALTGPTGYAGLKVRQWVCGCGAEHDRDINAAINTLIAGAGAALEGYVKAA